MKAAPSIFSAIVTTALAGAVLASTAVEAQVLSLDRDAQVSRQRIPAGDAIRAKMTAIRDLVAKNHSLITHRRMPKQAAIGFAEAMTRHTAVIRQSATDEPARSALSPLLGSMDRGARAVAGTADGLTQIDGIVEIDEALAKYAQRFDHPGWKAAREP